MLHHTSHAKHEDEKTVKPAPVEPKDAKETKGEQLPVAPLVERTPDGTAPTPIGSLADDETRAKDALLRLAQRAGATSIEFDRTDGDRWIVVLRRDKPAARAGA